MEALFYALVAHLGGRVLSALYARAMRSFIRYSQSALRLTALAGGLVLMACGPSGQGDDPNGAGSDDTRGAGSGASDFTNDPSGSDGVGAPGGPGVGVDEDGLLPPSDLVDLGPVKSCTVVADCCEGEEDCDVASFVCAAADGGSGECGQILGECSEASDCTGDSYCCTAADDCLTVGGPDVCIPGNVGKGAECTAELEIGVFSPSLQCEWLGPGPDDPVPNSKQVSHTPLVADTPYASGEVSEINPDGTSSEIVIVTWDLATGNGNNTSPGVIRILDGQSCELLASIEDSVNKPRGITTPALADLDGDGTIEIIARTEGGGVVAYKFDADSQKYKVYWAQANGGVINNGQQWGGVSVHDVNDDGKPEVMIEDVIFNGQSGAVISASNGSSAFNGILPVVADFDDDGTVDYAGRVAYSSWIMEFDTNGWKSAQADRIALGSNNQATLFATADFGSRVEGSFDFTKLDGKAEVVNVDDNGVLNIFDTAGDSVLTTGSFGTQERGGPPNIGDFDGDGFPEISVAGKTKLRVIDPGCDDDCENKSKFVRWSQASNDSSGYTGSTLFDFDGDGFIEVVYADECFLRVYRGLDGSVLYSNYRTSPTWNESPLVADIDRDQNTEIVVNNGYVPPSQANGFEENCPAQLDSIHPGIGCDTDAECPATSTCGGGYCRCSGDSDCGGDPKDTGLKCAAGIEASAGGDNVCRSYHPGSDIAPGYGIRVFRDSLDRWASSRSIYNQHAYSITNVNDDGSIPKTSDWEQNFAVGGPNNYRAQQQGEAGFADLPDITGGFRAGEESCVTGALDSRLYLQATVCNRGKRAVGSELPATFYKGEAGGEVLCTSYTNGPVPVDGCKLVYCAVGNDLAGQKVTVVVNDDGDGNRTTVECTPDNNSDQTTVEGCETESIIVR